MRRFVAAIALSGFVAVPAHAEPATLREDYVAGLAGDAGGQCRQDNPAGVNIARVCFPATAGTQYRISIQEALGHAVGYEWKFTDARGECVGADPDDPLGDCPNVGLACGTKTLGAPAGAVQLTILIDGVAFGAADCLLDGPGDSPGFGTVGTVVRTRL